MNLKSKEIFEVETGLVKVEESLIALIKYAPPEARGYLYQQGMALLAVIWDLQNKLAESP